ncbi:helix-turn-helix domain-containing protein [Vogesella sp. LIG4]|uniref:helix-turn-helix domain-containing protein n=1 Tax=Vogesella sp. LIG4 TaxID=1192162 RepID=UPI00082019D6|nr:cupin domain-containing protein [Vogesella sp. LIG4]SCK16437.1 Transcriptional regulator, contains XRE-family HTH domain [Vogesella sp. LIG4]
MHSSLPSQTTTPAADKPQAQIGEKLRLLRKRNGLTLAALAERCGLSIAHISLIERNLAQPSINALVALAQSLDVTVQWFFGPDQQQVADEADFIVRKPQRTSIEYEGGFTDQLLTPRSNRQLEMLHCRIAPGASSEETYTHEGAEAGLLLKGRLELWVGERHFQLDEGDSFSFSSREPHRYRNPGKSEAVVIWVITPATY